MFVERGALQVGQVECDGRGRVLVLAEQVMAGEVVLGEGDEDGRGGGALAGEDLLVDVAGEVLDPYLAEAGFGWDCSALEGVKSAQKRSRIPARDALFAALPWASGVGCAVARHLRDVHQVGGRLAAAGESRGRFTTWAATVRWEQRIVEELPGRHLMPSGGLSGACGRRWLAVCSKAKLWRVWSIACGQAL